MTSLKDGRLASSFDDNSIKITNDSNFDNYSTLNGHTDLINVLISYKDDILISGSNDKTIKLWNTTSMNLIDTLTGHNSCINAISIITIYKKDYIVSGSTDSTLNVWNTDNINLLYQLETNHTDSIQAIAYQEKLQLMAIGSKDKSFSLWQIKEYNGKKSKTIYDYSSSYVLAILPNTNIVSGCEDSTIKIWNSVTYELKGTYCFLFDCNFAWTYLYSLVVAHFARYKYSKWWWRRHY